MNMTRLWCIVLVACSGVAFAATDGQDLLDQYRKIYDASVTQYETDYRMAAQAWPIDYIRDLKALQTEQQSDGNLDGWERVNKELTRFRAEPTLAGIRSSLPELRSIQDTYRSNIEKFENEKRTKTEDLTEKYVARLEALQRDWTKDAKFDIAFAARDEIKRVEANRPATVEAEVEPSASEASKQTPKRSASSTETITHRDGTTVTPPGAPPPDKDGIRFSQKRLTTTDRSPWSTVIAIKLWDASETAKSSFEKDRFRGVVDAESKTDMRLARIGLQTT